MIVLSAQHIKKSFGVNQVLKDVSFVLQTGQRLGLVGVNGSGKSTLLRILTGDLRQDDGAISLQKGMHIGYLAQAFQPQAGKTVYEELESVFESVFALEKKMRRLEKEMSVCEDEEMLDRLSDDYALAVQSYEGADGYASRSLIQGVLAGLGFTAEQHQQEAAKLSGGELTRLSLGRLLLQKPDILLLDEPTNHLDLDALKWLEEFLSSYAGAVMLVSHDRYFLDHVCTDMVELLMGVSEQYRGNYSRYMEQRAERFESRTRAWDQQQKEIARQTAIIERFRSFNREKSIRAAESREKRLDKMARLNKPLEEKQIVFRFSVRRRMGEEALLVKNLGKSFGSRALFNNVNLFLQSGDRAALIGANGIGKTTFLECLMNMQSADEGYAEFGANADLGYYDQKQARLHPDKTVISEVWDDFPRLTQTEVRSALGLFLFSGDEAFAPIATLSGGERARVALTKLMLKKDNFLLLDEPTNHLDADSREMLESALDDFEGTILAVSHDRYFINRFANKVIVMEQSGLRVYEGNFDDYIKAVDREKQAHNDDMQPGMTRTQMARQRRKNRQEQEELKLMQAAVVDAEKQVALAENNLRRIEREMSSPDFYANEENAAKAARDYRSAQSAQEQAYALWEQRETELMAYEDSFAETAQNVP